jgi:PAS domain S-box-containing protein
MPISPSRGAITAASGSARFTVRTAFLVMLISLLVLGGWVLNIAVLKKGWPGLAAMPPWTATSLLLAGASLWLLHRNVRASLRRNIGLVCAALAALIGGLFLSESLAEIDLGLDLWLFRDAVLAEGEPYPGRPPPSTAYCLLSAGIALMALHTRMLWLAPLLALQILLISMLALVGYAYGISVLHQIKPYTSMALPTAFSLCTFALGLLSFHSHRCLAWMRHHLAESLMVLRFLPAAFLVLFAIYLLQLKDHWPGIKSDDIGWGLFVAFHIIVFSGLVYGLAKLLNEADAEREAGFAALQESEERFRQLFNASPNGMMMADLEGKITLANRQAEMLLGYAAGQLAGRKLESVLQHQAPERQDGFSEPSAVAFRPEARKNARIMTGLRLDGTEFIAQVEWNPLVTREGEMRLISLADITRRKHVEADRNRFVALANASVEFIGMCDQDFKPFYLNPAGMRMIGLENLEAALRIRVQDVFFPEDRALITYEFFPRIMREGHAEVEIRFRHFQTGEAIWMLFNVFSLHDEYGRASGWATVSRNIHARKTAEEALQRERSLLVSIMQATDFMLAFLDTRFNFVWVNQAYADTCGKQPDEMIGKNHFALYPDTENEAIFRRVRDTGEAVFYKDKPFVFPDQPERGTTYWDWSLTPVKTPGGSVSGLVFSLHETTHFKQAQEALIASEKRLQLALLGSKGGAWEWDLKRDIMTVSDSFRELYGLPPDQPVNVESWLGTVHPNDRERCRSLSQEFISNGKTEFEIEFLILHPQRGLRWLEGIGRLERDAEGRPARAVGIHLDITERKQVEEALRESEERLRLALKATRDVIWDWDIEHDAQRWSEAGAEVFGWREAVEGPQTAGWGLELMHPEDRVRVLSGLRAVLDDPACDHWEDEYRFVRTNGSYVDVLDRGFVIRDDAGKPIRMIGAMLDITERKQTEEKIRQINSELEQRVATRTRELESANLRLKNELTERERAEAETERFFTMSADLICILDADGDVRRVNAAFEAALGYSLGEMHGRPILDFVHPEDLASTKAEMEKLALGFPSIRYENRCRCRKGFYKWLGWTMQPAPDGTLYAIARDITETKLNEERIAASLREKEVLLKEIHHRVKNNLQVIASLLRLQADTLTDPVARDSFLDSQQRVHSMALAHEHLYQSQGLASINMTEYISSLVNSIRRSYGKSVSPVELRVEIANIELDIEQAVPMGLIISELAANSFKYAFAPPADFRSKLWVRLAEDDAGRLILEVGDNGRGIPDTVEVAQPSSMGLHLVQSFVLQLNGHLTVQRRPGAVFSISIPKKKDSHA